LIDEFHNIQHNEAVLFGHLAQVPLPRRIVIDNAFMELEIKTKEGLPETPETPEELFKKRAVLVALAAVDLYRESGSLRFTAFGSKQVVSSVLSWNDSQSDLSNADRLARSLLSEQYWKH